MENLKNKWDNADISIKDQKEMGENLLNIINKSKLSTALDKLKTRQVGSLIIGGILLIGLIYIYSLKWLPGSTSLVALVAIAIISMLLIWWIYRLYLLSTLSLDKMGVEVFSQKMAVYKLTTKYENYISYVLAALIAISVILRNALYKYPYLLIIFLIILALILLLSIYFSWKHNRDMDDIDDALTNVEDSRGK